MTVAELIHKLSSMPAGADVLVSQNGVTSLGNACSVQFTEADDSETTYGQVSVTGDAESEEE